MPHYEKNTIFQLGLVSFKPFYLGNFGHLDTDFIQLVACDPAITLWLFHIAMENGTFIDDFPIKTSICQGFSMAMLVITRWYP
jgi:hypothetical protein